MELEKSISKLKTEGSKLYKVIENNQKFVVLLLCVFVIYQSFFKDSKND